MHIMTHVGLLAGMLTTISFIPQVIKVVKTKHTHDISTGMYFILSIGISLWLVYGIWLKDIAIIIANTFSLILSLTILTFKLLYK